MRENLEANLAAQHNPHNLQLRRLSLQITHFPSVASISKLIHVANSHQSPWISHIIDACGTGAT